MAGTPEFSQISLTRSERCALTRASSPSAEALGPTGSCHLLPENDPLDPRSPIVTISGPSFVTVDSRRVWAVAHVDQIDRRTLLGGATWELYEWTPATSWTQLARANDYTY